MKKIKFLIAILVTGIVMPVHAELPDNVRDNLSEVIEDYCHSSQEYDLNKAVGEWDDDKKEWNEGSPVAEFHKRIDCILSSALEEMTEHSRAMAEKAYGSDLPVRAYESNGECGAIRLGTAQAEQQAKGFRSSCVKSDTEEVRQVFSSCRVAETVLNEWCGYDLFLYAKSRDEESFRELEEDLGFEMGERKLEFDQVAKRIKKERRDAEMTIFGALDWYQQTEHAARQNPWLIAVTEKLNSVKETWGNTRSGLGKFKDKFLNASVPPSS